MEQGAGSGQRDKIISSERKKGKSPVMLFPSRGGIWKSFIGLVNGYLFGFLFFRFFHQKG